MRDRARRFLIAFLLPLGCAASAAVTGQTVASAPSTVKLPGITLPKGFHRAAVSARSPYATGPVSGATVALEERWFRGPVEVNATVIVFKDRAAKEKWDRDMRSRSADWPRGIRAITDGKVRLSSNISRPALTPHEAAQAKRRLREEMKKRGLHPDSRTLTFLTRSRSSSLAAVAMLERAVVMVGGFQHEEMVRRGEAAVGEFLTDRAFQRLVNDAAVQLVKQARVATGAPAVTSKR